jgi:hypothetical protein
MRPGPAASSSASPILNTDDYSPAGAPSVDKPRQHL